MDLFICLFVFVCLFVCFFYLFLILTSSLCHVRHRVWQAWLAPPVAMTLLHDISRVTAVAGVVVSCRIFGLTPHPPSLVPVLSQPGWNQRLYVLGY